MNSILMFAMAVVFSMPSGCQREERKPADPLKLGERFTAVCKVGEIGGGGGTLIAKDWVLTAAHVAEGMHERTGADLNVVFGNGEKIAVQKIFLHPQHVHMGDHDIALLQLERPVKDVSPMQLFTDEVRAGEKIIIAGHGDHRNTEGTWIRDGKLRAYTNIIDSTNATHIFFDHDQPGPDATELEGVSGPGDSGGPALIERNGQFRVAGVSSMARSGSEGIASYGTIELFVKVPAHLAWIRSVIAKPEEHPSFDDADAAREAERPSDAVEIAIHIVQDQAIRVISTALGSGDPDRIEAAIASTYEPAVLAKRDPATIMRNMPVLIEELSGAHYVGIMALQDGIASLKFEKGDDAYQLDIFFLPSHKVEQMAFRQL